MLKRTWIIAFVVFAGCGHLLDNCRTLAGRGDEVQREHEGSRTKNEQEDVFPLPTVAPPCTAQCYTYGSDDGPECHCTGPRPCQTSISAGACG